MSRALLALSTLLCTLPTIALDDPTISVSGSAKISVKPDLVIFKASVQSRAAEVSAAKADNDKKIAAVVKFLQSVNVQPRDVQTDFIEIDPVYIEDDKEMEDPFQSGPKLTANLEPTGYEVSRGLRIRIRDLEVFDIIYSGLVERGINKVGGISFQTTALQDLQNQARRKAMGAAKASAELLAGELGAKLSGVQSIKDATSGSSSLSMMKNGPFGDPFGPAPVPLSAGEIDVTASVHVVFRLAETDFDN